MRIDIREDNLQLDVPTRQTIERRARVAFGRVAPQTTHVRIIVRDVNGPRKGMDRTVAIDVRTRRGGEVHVETTANTVQEAADQALDRAARATARLLARQREFRRDSIRTLPDPSGSDLTIDGPHARLRVAGELLDTRNRNGLVALGARKD